MDKLTAIKIRYNDQTYSEEIPISILTENIEWDATHNLFDVIGNVDFTKGSIQDQIDQLFQNRASVIANIEDFVQETMPTYITDWLDEHITNIDSTVVLDSSLTTAGAAADAKATGDEFSELNENLNAINCKPTLNWVLGKSIDDSGVIFSNSACGITDEIRCNEGDVFICKNMDKDINNKWFIGFLVFYIRANGVDTFVSRNTFTNGIKITIPNAVNICKIIFGRQASSGISLTSNDISTYTNYEIYQKSAPLSTLIPFSNCAIQTSNADVSTELMAITSSLNGSNRIYSLVDNNSNISWYAAFSCNGINWQTSNNSSYSTTYLIPFETITSSAINRYKTVCLCINILSKSFVFKEMQDVTINDYVVQVMVDGINVTPWYSPAFVSAGYISNAMKPLMGIAVQGIRAFNENHIFNVVGTVSGSSMTYVVSDAKPNEIWYQNLLINGTSRQITNDTNDSTRSVFTELTLSSVSRYHLIAFTIRRPDFTFALKDAINLDLNDYIIALFFNGENVTPWSETLFDKISVAFDHLTPKVEYLTRNLYKIFKKVGCIGDSWTAGYLDTDEHIYGRSDGYAWTDYMQTSNNEWINGGYSGAMTSTYLTDEISSNGGGHLAIENAGQCQAYVIGLGFNDSRPIVNGGLTLGTSTDIKDISKNTFYSWYSRIIDWAYNLNEDAFIFCQTMYPPLNNGITDFTSRFAPYNQAIRDIVNYYQNIENNNKIRLLDLENRADLYASLGRGWDVNGSHHGCVGYEFLAECFKSVLGDELANNPALYHNIREIPYTS